MADPRNTVDFIDIDSHQTTFKAHSSVTASDLNTLAKQDTGVAVVLTSGQTVGKGSAGGRLLGKAVIYEADGKLTVQDRGYTKFKYTGTAPTVGASVAAHGDGTVEAASASGDNVVISVDTGTTTCVVKLR